MYSAVRSFGRSTLSISRICSILTSHYVEMSTDISHLWTSKHVGFMGAGQMAQAIAKGFLASGILKGSQITMTDRFGKSFPDAHLFEPIKQIQDKYGIEYLQNNDEMAKKSDIIFACIKPAIVVPALGEISASLNDRLVISVAAGTTLEQMRQVVPKSTRLIRVMPNTPCLVQAGAGIFSIDSNVSKDDVQLTKSLCANIFTVFEEVPESMISAASGISGCGPAYVFLIAEALADGGVRMGIPRPLAHKLAVSTIAGAAALMEKSGEHPAKLRGDVCSPGGATIAAIEALEEGGLRAALMHAVRAAAVRSEELS